MLVGCRVCLLLCLVLLLLDLYHANTDITILSSSSSPGDFVRFSSSVGFISSISIRSLHTHTKTSRELVNSTHVSKDPSDSHYSLQLPSLMDCSPHLVFLVCISSPTLPSDPQSQCSRDRFTVKGNGCQSVIFSSPVVESSWQVGSTHTVTLEAQGLSPITNVTLLNNQSLPVSSASLVALLSDFNINDTTYTFPWTVADVPFGHYSLLLYTTNGYQFQSRNFTIRPSGIPAFSITTPSTFSGSILTLNSSSTLNWNLTDGESALYISSVDIYLWSSNAIEYESPIQPIATNLSKHNHLDWIVQLSSLSLKQITANYFYIEIKSSTNESIQGRTADFCICPIVGECNCSRGSTVNPDEFPVQVAIILACVMAFCIFVFLLYVIKMKPFNSCTKRRNKVATFRPPRRKIVEISRNNPNRTGVMPVSRPVSEPRPAVPLAVTPTTDMFLSGYHPHLAQAYDFHPLPPIYSSSNQAESRRPNNLNLAFGPPMPDLNTLNLHSMLDESSPAERKRSQKRLPAVEVAAQPRNGSIGRLHQANLFNGSERPGLQYLAGGN
eukprot:GILJ01008364.1.p1 GENE.GILJ01008364.1~~GILJ01008364.1.p1  ORF type:complete len:554 (-),score=59.67 GILJ01008364.1:190-1851(-)